MLKSDGEQCERMFLRRASHKGFDCNFHEKIYQNGKYVVKMVGGIGFFRYRPLGSFCEIYGSDIGVREIIVTHCGMRETKGIVTKHKGQTVIPQDLEELNV